MNRVKKIIAVSILSFANNLITVDSSEDDDDDDLVNNCYLYLLQKGDKPIRITLYVETVVANYNAIEFQSHFRMSYESFQFLLNRLAPLLENNSSLRTIPPKKQHLAIIWLLATPDSYRSVGERFDMAKSTLSVCFVKVVKCLCQLSSNYIKWPQQDQILYIKRKFQRISKLPNAIGAIDGTNIAIKAPKENAECYINRKCFYGITLQGICDPSLQFIDCFVGYPSSVSDSRIFRNSHIYEDITNNQQRYLNDENYLLGDKAYPQLNWLMTPYINRGNLTERKIYFNTMVSKGRQVIERTFALLKGRFRRLKYLDMNRTDLIPATILATCVLHNICLLHHDNMIEEYINEGVQLIRAGNYEDDYEEPIPDGRHSRKVLSNLLWRNRHL